MRYPFRATVKKRMKRTAGPSLRLRGKNAPRRTVPLPRPIEAVRLDGTPSRRVGSERCNVLLGILRTLARNVLGRIGARLRRMNRKSNLLPMLSGALCAALLVCFLSAGGVLLALFSEYGRSHTKKTVPSLVGLSEEELDTEGLHLIIEYEDNPDVPEGTVISQSPKAGVTRRLYRDSGKLVVHLTVSRSDDARTVPSLRGSSHRDAVLLLRNMGMKPTVSWEYSNDLPKGAVLASIPEEGTEAREGDGIRLRVSLGVRTLAVRVPELYGRTEAEAQSLLRAAGLIAGEITYQSSDRPAGTVISQDIRPYSSASEGQRVSFTVSLGMGEDLPTVPDLYGMSVEQARDLLRSVGLVVGTVTPIQSASPTGTVLAQSPEAGTQITSSTVSVELFVSS